MVSESNRDCKYKRHGFTDPQPGVPRPCLPEKRACHDFRRDRFSLPKNPQNGERRSATLRRATGSSHLLVVPPLTIVVTSARFVLIFPGALASIITTSARTRAPTSAIPPPAATASPAASAALRIPASGRLAALPFRRDYPVLVSGKLVLLQNPVLFGLL